MPQVAQPQCPKCKKWVDVYVDDDRPISMDERFLFRCPECGTQVNEALKVFTLVDSIPDRGAVATKAAGAAPGGGGPAVPATTDVTITVTCVGGDTINQVLQFPGQVNVTRQVVSHWNASVAFLDANAVWRTWRVQPTPQDAARGLLPNNGPSTLRVRVEAVGAHTFVEQFV